jgi:predicted PurR-regulated permease PerM
MVDDLWWGGSATDTPPGMQDFAVSSNILVRSGAIILALVLAVVGAWMARNILLLAFFAVVLATVLSLPIALMTRWMLGVILVALLASAVGVGLGVAPVLADQAQELMEQAPAAIEKLKSLQARYLGGDASSEGASAAPPEDGAPPASGGGAAEGMAIPQPVKDNALPAVFALGQGVASVLLVCIMAVFLVATPDTYRNGARLLVPDPWQQTFDEAWDCVAHDLRGWVRGVSISMLINGLLAAIGLWAVGLDQWLLLGVITMLCSFVPYLGAIVSATPALLIASAEGGTLVLWTLGVYTGVQLFEGYVLTPMVMRRAVEVKPALLLLGQGVMTAVFGLMGTIVATPMVVCLEALVGYLWVERALNHTGRDGDSDG